MKLLLKILLTIVYPVWYVLAKTWVGNVLCGIISISLLPTLLSVFFYNEMFNVTEQENEDTAMGMGGLSLLVAPFIGLGMIILSVYMEDYYEEWGYKTKKITIYGCLNIIYIKLQILKTMVKNLKELYGYNKHK